MVYDIESKYIMSKYGGYWERFSKFLRPCTVRSKTHVIEASCMNGYNKLHAKQATAVCRTAVCQ